MVKSLGDHQNELYEKFMKTLTPEEKKIVDEFTALSGQVLSTKLGSEKSNSLLEKQVSMFKKYSVLRRRNDLRWK